MDYESCFERVWRAGLLYKGDNFGSLVWGKFSKTKWWPGIIIDGALAGQPPPKPGSMWLMWFGDLKISQLPVCKIAWFGCDFKLRVANLCKIAEEGLTQALEVCATRLGVSPSGSDGVRAWARAPDVFCSLLQPKCGQADPLAPSLGEEYPLLVLRTLQNLGAVRSGRFTGLVAEPAAASTRRKKAHKPDPIIIEKYLKVILENWSLLKERQEGAHTCDLSTCDTPETDSCSLTEGIEGLVQNYCNSFTNVKELQ